MQNTSSLIINIKKTPTQITTVNKLDFVETRAQAFELHKLPGLRLSRRATFTPPTLICVEFRVRTPAKFTTVTSLRCLRDLSSQVFIGRTGVERASCNFKWLFAPLMHLMRATHQLVMRASVNVARANLFIRRDLRSFDRIFVF